MIDHYNHKMKVVDLSNQLNASFRTKVQVRRYWFAMWEHGTTIARVNSYVVCWYVNQKADSHGNQKFMTEWVEAFMGHATALQNGKTQRAVAAAASLMVYHGRARSWMSHIPPFRPYHSKATPENTNW